MNNLPKEHDEMHLDDADRTFDDWRKTMYDWTKNMDSSYEYTRKKIYEG